jgi:myo-inositol 2-dehydrogenase/D-chiro-inositol 1-dehydrogenase
MTRRSIRRLTRRSFLKTGGLAAGVPLFGGLQASSLAAVEDANQFLRLGWIGVGGRGTSLLRHALNNVSVSTLRVNAICDIDAAARQRAIGMCGAMNPEGIEDYRELLARKDIDVVFIATPIHLHAEHAVAAMQAGKHAYCEKPLGRTAEEVKAVYQAVKQAKRKFQVGFQWRYHAGFRGLVDAVQGGAAGKVSFVTAERHVAGYPASGWYVDRNLSGDLIVEQAVHEMNVFCWMLEGHPLRAAGFGGINALEGIPKERTIMDAYAVTFEFPENIRVNYSHCVYTADGFTKLHQTVYGRNRKAITLDGTNQLFVTQDGKRTQIELPEIRDDATEAAIQSLADCIRNDKEPLSNVDAGRNATLTAILGRTAIHERRVVEWREVALDEKRV